MTRSSSWIRTLCQLRALLLSCPKTLKRHIRNWISKDMQREYLTMKNESIPTNWGYSSSTSHSWVARRLKKRKSSWNKPSSSSRKTFSVWEWNSTPARPSTSPNAMCRWSRRCLQTLRILSRSSSLKLSTLTPNRSNSSSAFYSKVWNSQI